jgi:ornithine decarboxylase
MTNDLPNGGLEASVFSFSLSEDQLALQKAPPAYIDHDLSDAYIRTLNPSLPVSVLNPGRLLDKTHEFIDAFPGHVMYAVKCNPDRLFLKTMYEGGVRRFDVASIGEVRLVRGLFPDAELYFMHPIKAPEAIREAYINHGVRAFVLDYADELEKILHETNAAPDLELFVRLGIPKDSPGGGVATDFASKFGAKPEEAAALLARCRPYCQTLGLSFHVGTQCGDPSIYEKAIAHTARVIEQSGVSVDVLDVGGGFPADLTEDNTIPPVRAFTDTIGCALARHSLQDKELLCEVGRGLVACAGSLIVRVEGRKGDLLYLNDGTYGGLFEAGGSVGLPYPVHLIRRQARSSEDTVLTPFRFAGPTCDSVDMMQGPFMLPDDIRIGDWIKIDQLGAYGEVSRTDFNGFGTVQKVIVQQDAMQKKKRKIA